MLRIASLAFILIAISGIASGNKFPYGQLRHGRPYVRGAADMAKFDYISAWVGDHFPLNQWHEGEMVHYCKNNGKTCQFYMYVIAFTARSMKGIQDCDVKPDYSLCTDGAEFIRKNRAELVKRYDSYAAAIAKIYGSTPKLAPIFNIEADLYQYSNNSYKHNQKGGPLSGAYLGALFNDFVSAIKKHIPNALISWDISAWLQPALMKKWWSNFPAARIDFINTSGGQSKANSPEIKPREIRYREVHKITGKKILADCGYGVGGKPDDGCVAWGVKANIDARIADGVIAVNQDTVKYSPSYRPKV